MDGWNSEAEENNPVVDGDIFTGGCCVCILFVGVVSDNYLI